MSQLLNGCQPIATWFRYCLSATAIFNLFGAISFAPPIYYRTADSLGFPKYESPFLLWVLASWILIFGLAYAWLAIKAKPEYLFVAVAAACKVAIALFLIGFYLSGDLPAISLFAAAGDLLFALIFIIWIFLSQRQRLNKDH
ncbi:MAG TPA: hypothetical protein V6D29_05960 [Leptolyngbyaceae cyanobacterium]